MLRVMLIDDERLARQALRASLDGMAGVEIVAEADGADRARDLIAQTRPHALFLDVQMPRESGFELLRGLNEPLRIVFVTAHSEHAVRAFEVEAIDFLLKPVRKARLEQAVARLQQACGLEVGAETEAPYSASDRICLRTPGRTLIAPLARVVALEAESDFTRVFVADEAPLLICQKLGTYERMLPNPPFLRVDRSLMLNVMAITRTVRPSRDEEHVWCEGVAEPFILGRAAQARLRGAV